MKRKIGGGVISILTSIVGGAVVGYAISYFAEIDDDIFKYSLIGALGIIFGILEWKNYILIDTENDEFSYPFLLIFRRRIKLSEVESYTTETERKVDNEGKVSYKHYLVFYGPFGEKRVRMSESEIKQTINAFSNL